ncbi:MAG: CRISPR-associated helicase Cas3' [Anaerolineae bacterium]|nr:CRISPR-associated helicase Cas3' [Anaerolineae bacterium]
MKPYLYQRQVAQLVREGRSIILQAPTGAGKTFASLWPFYKGWAAQTSAVPDKCIYAVPMRVLANQFEEEVRRLVNVEMRFKKPPHVEKQTGEYKNDKHFKADITFATIDQVLSSWLMHPYSLSGREGNLNAGAFVGSYLIFDEFHLFDPDSTLPTTLHMLKALKGIAPFILMTATFSAEMLTELAAELDAVPLLLTPDDLADVPSQNKTRYYHTVNDPLVWRDEHKQWHVSESAVQHILDLHMAQSGQQRTLIVCNQVERAQRLYDAIAAVKAENVHLRLLHSRFRQSDRQAHEEEVRREFGKVIEARRFDSMIVVATQVVEVGLDMSAQVLHTELGPASAILQRAGRCARRQGETGHVYVYPTDTPMPYRGAFAKQQCELTMQWLRDHEGQHLDFAKEQELINCAHSSTDRQILDGIKGTSLGHKEEIERLWMGDGNRGDAVRLIRDISAVSLIVQSAPDQLLHAPFKAESFSLHPGTIRGAFTRWEEAKEDTWDRDGLEWTVCYLQERDVDEDSAESNAPIRYEWVPVMHPKQIAPPLLAVHPTLVGYSAERGLTLYPGDHYECAVPERRDAVQYQRYTYQLESYADHIRHVYDVFEEQWVETIGATGSRLEKRFGWPSGVILEAARLTVLLHDVGKLRVGWQQWARAYHQAIGYPLAADFVAAHTLSQTDEQREKAKRIRPKRPHHAVESAVATYNIFHDRFPTLEPLRRAAFTAICRHHTPTAKETESYSLIAQHNAEIAHTLRWLEQPFQAKPAIATIQATQRINGVPMQEKIEVDFLIRPHNSADIACYMLLVRALRFSDQEGTSRGNTKSCPD